MLSRDEYSRVAGKLASLSFAGSIVLVGSSVLYALGSSVPPMTEDVDIVVPETLLRGQSMGVRQELEACGFRQVEGTATWIDERGASLDLLAVAEEVGEDRAGGTVDLPAMVFADLARIILQRDPRGVEPGSPGHLSRAGLVMSKLTTMRLEKGPKDRLHALLLLQEGASEPGLRGAVAAIAGAFPPSVLEDILPEAQMALLSLSRDRTPGSDLRTYASRIDAVRDGFRLLGEIGSAW